MEALVIAALAAQVLLLVALLTYGPTSADQRPLVGVVGHFLAGLLWKSIGGVSIVVVGLGIFTTVVALVRRTVTAPAMRVVGGVLLLLGACTLVHQIFRPQVPLDPAVTHPFGLLPGGVVGKTIFGLFLVPFGAFGTVLLSATLMCTGFAFATDWLLYEMLLDGLKRAGGGLGILQKFWPKPLLSAAAAGVLQTFQRSTEFLREKREARERAATAAVLGKKPPTGAPTGAVVLDDPEVLVPPEMLPDAPAPAEDEADEQPAAPFEVRLEPPAPPQPAEVVLPRTSGEYVLPGLDLLDHPKPRDLRKLERAIEENAKVLQRTLSEFRVEGNVVAFQQGPVVTMLEVSLAPGTKVTKIHTLADDLAMALKVPSVRIVAPIPGKSTVGVEIPNPIRENVRLLPLLESDAYKDRKQFIPLFLGTRADGTPMVDDLAKMPHLLVAGATGSGKSVSVNTILLSILLTRSPDEVKLILVDPKQVELAFFANIPHLLSPVVTEMKRAASVLEWAVAQMEDRYDLLRRFEVRNIASYNELGERAIKERIEELGLSDEVIPVRLPYIVMIVDELADLMLTVGKEVEKLITRLAQKSRAVGIHIILATQRPSTDVITGLIKANMPTRIAFQVASKVDSRVILDQNGADKLLGMGDMLYLPPRSSAVLRAQGTFVSDPEVKRVVRFLKDRYNQEFNDELVEIGTAALLDESEKDNLYDEAVRVVLHERRGSASLLQRALAIGYTRASRLLDLMRKEGVVGPYKGSKASDVLLTLEQYEQLVSKGKAASNDEYE